MREGFAPCPRIIQYYFNFNFSALGNISSAFQAIKGRTPLKPLLFILAIIGLIVVVFNYEAVFEMAGLKSNEDNRGDRRAEIPVKVITQPIESAGNDRIFEALGTGRALQSVQIYPAVADQVTQINFKAQQKIKAGDVLVQLDDREEVLAVKLAEVELADAKSLLDRYEKAGKQGAVPESEVDSARATFEGAQVALETAQLELEQRKIIAPIDGVVGIPAIDVGDRIDTTTMITGLDNRSEILIDFEIPEALASAVSIEGNGANSITATTPAYPGQEFKGKISAQESRIDPDRRTMMLRASIDNTQDLLRPGMSFMTRWTIPGGQYLSVPEISVQWGREGSYIWVARENKAVKMMVKVIARRSGSVLIEGEIKEGEQVVIEGIQRLREGQVIEMPENSDAATNAPVEQSTEEQAANVR